jgi:hypothetical protein
MSRKEFTTKTRKAALKRSNMRCEAVGCDKPVFRRCLCAAHYSRLLRHGDIEATAKPANGDILTWLEDRHLHIGEECLAFPFLRNGNGYGRVTYGGQRIGAHRAMCILAHGEPPTPKHEAAHSCGKGHEGCVNPGHLRWATRVENLADRVEHNGGNRGSRHGNAKLSAEVVIAIRRRLAAGEAQASIAVDCQIEQSTVSKINRRVLWGWLNG